MGYRLDRPFPAVIYTDGSVNPNKSGGWGALVILGYHKRLIGGHFRRIGDSQNAELMAIVRALDWLKYPSRVFIYTDAESVWRTWLGEYKRARSMAYYWREYDRAAHRHPCVEIHKIRGHSGVYGNEQAHLEAKRRARQL